MAEAGGDKYGDIFGPGGEVPGWIIDDGGGVGGGGGGGGGGSMIPNPFIPGFAGGQAPGFAGFGAETPWGGGGGFQPRRRLAGTRSPFGASQSRMDGSGAQMMGAGAGPFGGPAGAPGGLADRITEAIRRAGAGSGGKWAPNNGRELVGDILGPQQYAGGMHGGAWGWQPPPGVLAAIRGQAVQDAGARERSARLGLQTRGDTDPSTYGFQALMSQLGGQDQTARAMSQADLGLRQQQLAFLQNLLGQYLGASNAWDMQNRQNAFAGDRRGGIGGALGSLGGLLGGVSGLGGLLGGGGGGGGGVPTMGQPGFQYYMGG